MSMMRTILALLPLLLPVSGWAEEEEPLDPPPKPPEKPVVEKIDDSHYRIGQVTLDKATREIRFPAAVNMVEGPLEFLLVHVRGKVHESLFSTEVSPTHLNLAFTLLRYTPSPELYATDSPPEHEAGSKFPEVAADVKAAARVNIKVEWSDKGEVKSFPVNDWVLHTTTAKAMPAGPWVYGGSEFSAGRFQAESTGDMIAIFLSSAALLNYPGQDDRDDDVWTPFTKRVPPIGTKVTLVISPNSPVKTDTKP